MSISSDNKLDGVLNRLNICFDKILICTQLGRIMMSNYLWKTITMVIAPPFNKTGKNSAVLQHNQ